MLPIISKQKMRSHGLSTKGTNEKREWEWAGVLCGVAMKLKQPRDVHGLIVRNSRQAGSHSGSSERTSQKALQPWQGGKAWGREYRDRCTNACVLLPAPPLLVDMGWEEAPLPQQCQEGAEQGALRSEEDSGLSGLGCPERQFGAIRLSGAALGLAEVWSDTCARVGARSSRDLTPSSAAAHPLAVPLGLQVHPSARGLGPWGAERCGTGAG